MMPIPSLKHAVQCRAIAKSTNQRCMNLAVRGWPVCRLHGVHKKIVRGAEHGAFKHGQETREARADSKKTSEQLRQIKAALKKLGLL